MARIKSNHDAPLGLPGGPVIPAGATVLVENWGAISGNDVVKAWLSVSAIEVVPDDVVETVPSRRSTMPRRKPDVAEGEGSE